MLLGSYDFPVSLTVDSFSFSGLQHSDMVTIALIVLAILLAVVPVKLFLMAATLCCFLKSSKAGVRMGKIGDNKVNRRLKEWWDSIPVIPVRVADEPLDSPTCS